MEVGSHRGKVAWALRWWARTRTRARESSLAISPLILHWPVSPSRRPLPARTPAHRVPQRQPLPPASTPSEPPSAPFPPFVITFSPFSLSPPPPAHVAPNSLPQLPARRPVLNHELASAQAVHVRAQAPPSHRAQPAAEGGPCPSTDKGQRGQCQVSLPLCPRRPSASRVSIQRTHHPSRVPVSSGTAKRQKTLS